MEKIQVSICCLVYNHEKYLRKCLDGFMMQEGVSFEVLIHDDASTDCSANIIREYEKRYPNIIKPTIQVENQLSKGVEITSTFLYPRAEGKYIALCEGDDYWTDKKKLKKQFDELEKHSDCKMCVHDVQQVTEDGSKTDIFFPSIEIRKEIIDSDTFFNTICKQTRYPFQTSSYFFDAYELKKYSSNPPSFSIGVGVGDLPMLFHFANCLSICYIKETLSAYRKGSADSWNNRIYNNSHKRAEHYKKLIGMYKEFEKTSGRQHCFDEDIDCYKYYSFLLEEDYSNALTILKKNRSICRDKREIILIFVRVYFPHIYYVYRKLRHNK